jgi:epoxide hydrolase-like predicted phosphatase
MTIKAVFFDFGGVLVRTEFQAPRQHLADRLQMEYDDLVDAVFDSETGRRATVGQISEAEHWTAVMKRLKRPLSELDSVRDEFFAGDVVDRPLVEFVRGLRPKFRTGLISNAWSGLRAYIVKQKFEDAFDAMTISAEVGEAKPAAPIFQIALDALGVAPAESVFLDDFAENVEGARAAGMQAIHFTQPEKALGELKKILTNHR